MHRLQGVEVMAGSPVRRYCYLIRTIAPATFFLGVMALAGCATSPAELERLGNPVATDTQPMIGIAGFRDQEQFYVQYRRGDKISYAGGNWRSRVKLVDEPLPGATEFAVPSLVAMEYHQQTPWVLPPDAVNIPVLGVDKWQRLREQILRHVVPADGSGLVVDFEHVEYFLYFDESGRFNATLAENKPLNYRVQGNMRFDEFMRRGRPILEAFLRQAGITSDEFVFNTGDAGLYSLPFLYINTRRQLLIFVRNVPLRPQAVTALPGMKSTQAFGHMMRSHLSDLVVRPVSSLHRLFFVLTDTAINTVSFDWTAGLLDQPPPALVDSPPMNAVEWERELDRIAGVEQTFGTVDLLVDGEAFFTRFVESIEAAEQSLRLQTYIFDNDDYAIEISNLLKRRSNEGLEIRVLLDGLGTLGAGTIESPSLPEAHQPPRSMRQYLKTKSEIEVRLKANPWFTGDHVKSTVVDGSIAFVGGMNIGREYRYDWHDLMVELQGPVAGSIARQFDGAWAHAGPLGDLSYLVPREKAPMPDDAAGQIPLRLLLTGPGNYEIFEAQIAAMRRTRQRIYVQNAYLTDDQMLRELVLARRRGVDVRVVVPMETDSGLINRSNVLAINLMLKHGIRVFLYPGFSHVKAAVYDGWSCLGSANFDRLSLQVNHELNIASSHPELTNQLVTRVFEPDFQVSPELLEPIPERWVDHLVEIMGDYFF